MDFKNQNQFEELVRLALLLWTCPCRDKTNYLCEKCKETSNHCLINPQLADLYNVFLHFVETVEKAKCDKLYHELMAKSKVMPSVAGVELESDVLSDSSDSSYLSDESCIGSSLVQELNRESDRKADCTRVPELNLPACNKKKKKIKKVKAKMEGLTWKCENSVCGQTNSYLEDQCPCGFSCPPSLQGKKKKSFQIIIQTQSI